MNQRLINYLAYNIDREHAAHELRIVILATNVYVSNNYAHKACVVRMHFQRINIIVERADGPQLI